MALDLARPAGAGGSRGRDEGFPARGRRPIRLKLTEGQAHDGRSAADMLGTVEAGHILLADRAYDSDALRVEMAERGAWANIRATPNRVRTFPFSAWVYRQRNAVERCFSKLKHFRGRRHPIRQARRQLPRLDPTRLNPHMAAKL